MKTIIIILLCIFSYAFQGYGSPCSCSGTTIKKERTIRVSMKSNLSRVSQVSQIKTIKNSSQVLLERWQPGDVNEELRVRHEEAFHTNNVTAAGTTTKRTRIFNGGNGGNGGKTVQQLQEEAGREAEANANTPELELPDIEESKSEETKEIKEIKEAKETAVEEINKIRETIQKIKEVEYTEELGIDNPFNTP